MPNDPLTSPFHVLFVCTMNPHRSRTAHDLFARLQPSWIVSSAGTALTARQPLSSHTLSCVQQIVCMENDHRLALLKRFPDLKERLRQHNLSVKSPPTTPLSISTLAIPDIYNYGDPQLQQLLLLKHAQGLIGPL